jgi:hypothetical protein
MTASDVGGRPQEHIAGVSEPARQRSQRRPKQQGGQKTFFFGRHIGILY